MNIRMTYLYLTKQSKGFTLVELLVVIIIIGILGAITVPTLFSKTFRAREIEAKQYVAQLVRDQQIYRASYGEYSKSVEELNPSIPVETEDYVYVINNNNPQYSLITGAPKDDRLASVAGKVFSTINSRGESELGAVICASLDGMPSMESVKSNKDCPPQ